MKIALIGATGNIGSRILKEAMSRRHEVLALTRDARKIVAGDTVKVAQSNTDNVAEMSEFLRGNDVVICSVKWNENSVDNVIRAVRESGVRRALFVVGAGSLLRSDGRIHFDHMKEMGIEPPTSKPAMLALDALREVDDFDWTAISPPFDIYPGERTGIFVYGNDEMPRATKGHPIARISMEDFAVAILNEVEEERFTRQRFTVAN